MSHWHPQVHLKASSLTHHKVWRAARSSYAAATPSHWRLPGALTSMTRVALRRHRAANRIGAAS